MNKIIIALDYPSENTVLDFLAKFDNEPLFLKVGLELYYSTGNSLLYKLKEKGHSIFLDLKLHDIPNTVGRAMEALAQLDIDLINVHASGGRAMMESALAGLEKGTACGQKRPKLIAVTQLTSTSEQMMQQQLKINDTIDNVIVHYAKNAAAARLDGVISSPLEVPLIKAVCGKDFLTVTPGIRCLGDAKDDQERITTPKQARQLGSDFIVVGRSITKSADPLTTYLNIKKEWSEASETSIS
ncbi:MAG: orotidine-5'-phosphate decarboxylase [Clostridiales Family XIII bacterium]|jgi:orotidine-5'-phosphate decarboxylase|nr:orotidine-5'-phosphate decarboxylase [Clostridiales Family XIII bacterium]